MSQMTPYRFTFHGTPQYENGSEIYHNSGGELHRLDGPAVNYANGVQEWWISGEKITCVTSDEQFSRYCKMKGFW